MKVTTIELTEQEANVLCDCMDVTIKATGIKSVKAIQPVFEKIVRAFQSALEIPDPVGAVAAPAPEVINLPRVK